MSEFIQILTGVIQALSLIVLIWYAVETYRLRKAAEEQVGVSQRLIGSAMDQVEGLSKPCLTLASQLRNPSDAILEINGAVGNTMAMADNGNFVVHNIGNGIALNVSYQFKAIGTNGPILNPVWRERYLLNALAGQRIRMVEPVNAYASEHEVHFLYRSIGGRKYPSIVTFNNHLLTALRFEEERDLDSSE